MAVFWGLHRQAPCACAPITAAWKDAAHTGLELTLMTSFTYDFISDESFFVLLNSLFCIGV